VRRAEDVLRLTKERSGELRKAFNLDHTAQRARAPAGVRGQGRGARQAAVDGDRQGHGAAATPPTVGVYEQVAESLLDYVGWAWSTLLIRGFSPWRTP